MKGSMIIVQMLEVSPTTKPQKIVRSQSLVWGLYVKTFRQLCQLLGIDDTYCGADWFGILGPNGSLAVVRQPALQIHQKLSWSLTWQLRLQVIYDLVQAMVTCEKHSQRDEYYFRCRSAQLIKFGIKIVEMIEENA